VSQKQRRHDLSGFYPYHAQTASYLIFRSALRDTYLGKKGEKKTFDVAAFTIAKYPVTNRQFRLFMDAKGYENRSWWTDAGWEAREQGWDLDTSERKWKPTGKGWTEPRFWQNKKWNGADYPAVGVSWYEAVAFCLWLQDKTGENVMLPTEQQWQRAAQALPDGRDSGYIYPWGNEWDGSLCNNSVGQDWQKNNTSQVTKYEEKGNSPCGVTDLIGNVWEWCLTDCERGKTDINEVATYRVLRGGSWYYSHLDVFRVVYREGINPHEWLIYGGFRCARS
jgi:formylglycine-generating enzyme required for sulfatase activity